MPQKNKLSGIQPLSLEDIDRLGELLASIPEPFSAMEADMLDGYLTALTLMRHPPEQSEWLSYVFDSDGNSRARLPEEKQAQLRKLILRRGAELEQAVLREKPIDPIIYEDSEDENTLSALQGFSDGFAAALSLWPELVRNDNKAVQAALVGILRYQSQDEERDEEMQKILSDLDNDMHFESLDEALADLASCVQEIAEVTRGSEIQSVREKSRR